MESLLSCRKSQKECQQIFENNGKSDVRVSVDGLSLVKHINLPMYVIYIDPLIYQMGKCAQEIPVISVGAFLDTLIK